jgi:alkylhydroperoxidase family enzyme
VRQCRKETFADRCGDAVYDMASQEFSEAELAQLTLAIVAINGWNRFNVAFHTPAGNYKSAIVRKAS